MSRQEALDLISSTGDPDPESFFAAVDKNEDDQLCVQNRTNTVHGITYHNYIDNSANR